MQQPIEELRKSVRFKIKDGTLRLHHPVMPALCCTLVDLSQGGLRCRMDTSALDNFAATSWRKLLSSGRLLSVEVLAPGLQQRNIINGAVRHVRLGDNNDVEFGLKFHKPDALQLESIDKAIRAYSRNRERHPYEPETIETPDVPSTSTQFMRSQSTRRVDPIALPKRKRKTLADAARMLWNELRQRKQKSINYRGMKIGEILMRLGRISPRQAVEAYEKARKQRIRFGRYLVRQQLITTVELSRALSLQTGLPIVDLANVTMPETVTTLFPHKVLQEYSFIPFNLINGELFVAVSFPLSKEAVKDLEDQTGVRLKIFLAYDEIIEAALQSPIFMHSGSVG